MMTRHHHILFLLAAFAWLALAAVEADPARRAWMNGYEAMTQADKALESQADLAALHAYEKALSVFQDVQSKFPGWNVSLINYRIEYCQKKIKAIKDANRQNVEYLSKDDLLAQLSEQANELQTLKERLATQERDLTKSAQALEKARAEAASLANSEDNYRLMKSERDELSARVRSLASQLSDLKEEMKKSGLQDERKAKEDLSTQLKRSQEELATVSRELERVAATRDDLLAQTQRDAKWRKEAETQIAELRRLAENARRQHEETEAQLQKIQGTVSRMGIDQDNLENLPTDVNSLQSHIRAQAEKLHSTQMELLSTQRKLTQAEETATRLGQELADERLKSSNSAAAVSDELDNGRRARQENAELKDQNSRLEKTVASQKELLASLESASAEKERELEDCRQKLDLATADKDKLMARLQLTDASGLAAAGLAENAAEMQEELTTARQNIQNLTQEREKLSNRLTKTEDSLKNASSRLQQVAGNDQDAGARILQDRVDELQRELAEATNRIHDLESALVKRDMANRSLERALTDKGATEDFAGSGNVAQPIIPNGNGGGQDFGGLSPTDKIVIKGFLRQGVDAEKSGKTEVAQWNYRQALSMQPDNFLALKRLGLLASAGGDDAEAAKFLSAASKCNPDDIEVLLALGFAQLQLKQPSWALASLARATALKPQDSRSARLFGVALGAMEWREAAMVQLQKALELNSKDSEAAFNLAMITLTRASEIEFQARKTPEDRQALERLAATMRHQALEWYRQAVANGAQEDPKLEEALSK